MQRSEVHCTVKGILSYICAHYNPPPLTDIPTALIAVPASVVTETWYSPASLPSVLFTVRLRQPLENVYLGVLVQERLTVPLLPTNTHWIPSLVTGGTGPFTTVKEKVTGSPILIGLLITPSEGDTLGGTAEGIIAQNQKPLQ